MRDQQTGRDVVDATLLRVIVEQFIALSWHPSAEIAQFERLAGGLIDLAPAPAVASVAQALCLHPDTPPTIISLLLDKGGECARIALEFAPAIPAVDILVMAEHGPVELAEAIARRVDLHRDIIGALASRSEPSVLLTLATNKNARLDRLALRMLTGVARDNLWLARALLDRDDLDIDPESLFLAATRAERAAIILDACRQAIASGGVDSGMRVDAAVAVRLASAGAARDRDAMIAVLADELDCRRSRARAIVNDASGEALALAFAALGVTRALATRLFLCANAPISHDVARVRSLLALMRSAPPRAAARIVSSITGAARPEREAARRSCWREEAQAHGWRRGLGAAKPASEAPRVRKRDQSA
jgi:uncharacterized protein (DUF2336 family)